MQTGNQIESQSESFSAMPVTFAQNPEDFQSPDHVFYLDAFACQFSIELLFFLRQAMQLAVFQWQNHILQFGLQSPITQVRAQFQLFAKSHSALLKQFVIVRFAFPEKRRNNLLGFFVDQDLCFQRVPLFLARIISTLFFFGRSIKLSVTSTIVYLIASPSSSRFLPGSANLPDLIKIFSTRCTSRETFDSCSRQSRPRWNNVRYSRQKESVSNNWFSIDNLLFLPRLLISLYSRITAHIAAKVSLVTPQKRLKSPSFKFLTSS